MKHFSLACLAILATLSTALADEHKTDAAGHLPSPEQIESTQDPAQQDPLEPINRVIFEVNGIFYEVTSPIVEAAPEPARGLFQAIGAMVTAPVRIVTNIATGDEKDESLADIAKKEGMDCGFYLVLPLIGPSNLRDTVADTAGYAANPVAQVTVLSAGDAVDKRIRGEARIKQLDGALDRYAMARSASMQGRGCLVVEDGDAPSAFGEESTADALDSVR